MLGLGLSALLRLIPVDVLILSVAVIGLLWSFKQISTIKSKYVPYFLTLVAGGFYIYSGYELIPMLLLTVLTFTNTMIFTYMAPLFIHGETSLLTHERMKSLSVVVLISLLCLLPYSPIVCFIGMRIYLLLMVEYECLDDALPGLFYVSMLLILMNPVYKDDVLTLLIPLFFFYMIPCKNKLAIACLYFASNLILPFFVDYTYMYHGLIVSISGLLFFIIPHNKGKAVLSTEYRDITVRQKLTKQVDSFCRLFDQMTSVFNQTPMHQHALEYIGYIYEDVCQNCTSADTCFHQKYGPNRLVKLMNKGLKESYDDADIDFIDQYCLRPQQYIDSIEEYHRDYHKMYRIQQEYQTMKKDLYQQFSLLNDVFNQFSTQLQVGHIEEKHIQEHLEGYQFEVAHLKKYYESQNVYYLEIGLYETTREQVVGDLIPILESYLNETLQIESLQVPMNQLGYTYLVLKHQAKYFIQYGLTQSSKDPIACGDSYTVFSTDENQYFALSDGMGQGQVACEDSTLTLDIMKQLILNGVSLKEGIQSVNALLKIKNTNDMFTTLDMVQINLAVGYATFVKYGACSTYILRDHEVIEVQSQALPMGIVTPLETITQKYTLKEDDIIFMMSDGYSSDFGSFLEKNKYLIEGDHPKEITSLLAQLNREEEKSDDMTLIILKLCKQ